MALFFPQAIFSTYDVDKSGDMELAELRPALAQAGTTLSIWYFYKVMFEFTGHLQVLEKS